ncbi:MAG: hypothetical protein FJ288_08875 [Planctomycetes bacterium]|nr:hypothetical protein [Planctomycetota bacterium]
MPNFSTDADLVKWEPALLREIVLDHQCLTRGTGAASQTYSVVAEDGRFKTSLVLPDHIIYLRNTEQGVDGHYQVLSVQDETELLAGVIGGSAGAWAPLPTATDLEFAIHTFDPQHEEARYALLARFGLATDAADPATDLERWVHHRRALRRPAAALVLSMLYRGQASGGPEASGLARKAEHYARLYEDEVVKARLVLDRDGDGRPDDVRTLSSHRLRRD